MNAVTLSGALVAAAWVGAALTTEAGYSRRSLQDHDIVVDKDGHHSRLDAMSRQQLYFLTVEPDDFNDVFRKPSTSGSRAGSVTSPPPAVDLSDARVVKKTAPGLPVVIGSGATPETIADLLEVADAAIVGTSTKVGGVTTNPVDKRRAEAFLRATVTRR